MVFSFIVPGVTPVPIPRRAQSRQIHKHQLMLKAELNPTSSLPHTTRKIWITRGSRQSWRPRWERLVTEARPSFLYVSRREKLLKCSGHRIRRQHLISSSGFGFPSLHCDVSPKGMVTNSSIGLPIFLDGISLDLKGSYGVTPYFMRGIGEEGSAARQRAASGSSVALLDHIYPSP